MPAPPRGGRQASGLSPGGEGLPTAAIGRPRVDVTWRISGLFRDLFPAQIALIDAAVQAVAARDEDNDENPLAAARRAANGKSAVRLDRIFGTAPGAFARRVADADALVHASDDPGRDLLEGGEEGAFVGGFAAAAKMLGRSADLILLPAP